MPQILARGAKILMLSKKYLNIFLEKISKNFLFFILYLFLQDPLKLLQLVCKLSLTDPIPPHSHLLQGLLPIHPQLPLSVPDLWGCPHSRFPFPSASSTRGHWGATGRAGAPSASPKGHGTAALLPEEWWLPWRQQGRDRHQTRATMATTAGEEGAEGQKHHRKVYSRGAEVEGRVKHLEAGRHSQPSCSKQQQKPCL